MASALSGASCRTGCDTSFSEAAQGTLPADGSDDQPKGRYDAAITARIAVVAGLYGDEADPSLGSGVLLLEPGPVVLVTTKHKARANVMAMSWHTMMEFEPPLVGCVISNRNYSFDALKATRECVIAIPTAKLARKVVGCGNTSGRKVNKFSRLHLPQSPASRVAAPLIDDCYANLECRVVDTRMVARYNFFVLEVVKAWTDPSQRDPRTIHPRGRGLFMIAVRSMRLPSKMK